MDKFCRNKLNNDMHIKYNALILQVMIKSCKNMKTSIIIIKAHFNFCMRQSIEIICVFYGRHFNYLGSCMKTVRNFCTSKCFLWLMKLKWALKLYVDYNFDK
jgi:hypothetical protein